MSAGPADKKTLSCERGKGVNRHGKATTTTAVAHHVPTRLSFGTAHRKRPQDLSHVMQTLMSGVPVTP